MRATTGLNTFPAIPHGPDLFYLRKMEQERGLKTPSPKRKRAQTRVVIDLTQPEPITPKKSTPRKRRKTDHDELPLSPEKRLKRYRDHAPKDVMIKYDRVMSQRMFLVERSGRRESELHEDFSVLGSTGNVYVVNLNQIPTYATLNRK